MSGRKGGRGETKQEHNGNKKDATSYIRVMIFQICASLIVLYLCFFCFIIFTSNARLRTRSALSHRNHVCELSANYLFKADAIHVSLSRTQTLYTIKQVTLASATRLNFD